MQDCDEDEPLETPTGPAYAAVKHFAKYEWLFLHGFMEAWWAATTNGYHKSLQVHTSHYAICCPRWWLNGAVPSRHLVDYCHGSAAAA